jgi:hypothetical protein
MVGSIYCHAHNPESVKAGGAPTGNQNARRHGLYAKYLSVEELALVEAEGGNLGGASLDEEITAARVAVSRALSADDSKGITRSALAVARLMQIKRQLAGEQATGVVEAINSILIEFGLGEN